MITIKDLYDIVGNKMANETGKAFIRKNFPLPIAEQMCDAIDRQESAEHYMRILREYNEWMSRQQQLMRQFLQQYKY
jgi:hypothetical protein